MLKGLIVDDEYYSRKGLRSTLPWKENGFEIIGEADSKKTALEFLENQKVDVVFTDIQMPNESGLELIREINEKYEGIFSVIITCHRDFDYAREAARLGAIDYLIKTELEDEALTRNLNNIAAKIIRRQEQKTKLTASAIPLFFAARFTEENASDLDAIRRIKRRSIESRENGIYLYYIPESKLHLAEAFTELDEIREKWLFGIIENERINRSEELADYLQNQGFFYRDLEIGKEIPVLSALQDNRCAGSTSVNWLSLRWVFDDMVLRENLDACKEAMVPLEEVKKEISKAMNRWENCFICDISWGKLTGGMKRFRFFYDLSEYLKGIRHDLEKGFHFNDFAPETLSVIVEAIDFYHAHFRENISQRDIVRRFHLSQSYFSRSFHKIFGIPYIRYAMNYKVEECKELLLTDTSINDIAKEIGINDVKYLSHFFKKITGMSLSEFRLSFRIPNR